jgi:hypothetical protein
MAFVMYIYHVFLMQAELVNPESTGDPQANYLYLSGLTDSGAGLKQQIMGVNTTS